MAGQIGMGQHRRAARAVRAGALWLGLGVSSGCRAEQGGAAPGALAEPDVPGATPASEPADPGEADAGAVDAGVAAECAPGEARACTLDALCSGEQVCSALARFGPCDCGTGARVGPGVVGARCEQDADCPGGAACLRASGSEYFGVGGPAGGYCSLACTSNADCTALDPQSLCAQLGPDGGEYCIRTCRSLEPEPGEAKCLNRTDLVCVSAAADGRELFDGQRQEGYCAARCGSDAECPQGRVCDAGLGICIDAAAPGAGLGARCTLDQSCASNRCEERDATGVGVCSALCVLGAVSGCGEPRDASQRSAACLTPLVQLGRFTEGPGDLGLCRELCDQASDCERVDEGWGCTPINAGAAELFGRSGACTPG